MLLTFPKRKEHATPRPAMPQGKQQVLGQEAKQERGESLDQSLYWGFQRKGRAGQSEHFKDWPVLTVLVGWPVGVVSSCLEPGRWDDSGQGRSRFDV